MRDSCDAVSEKLDNPLEPLAIIDIVIRTSKRVIPKAERIVLFLYDITVNDR
jgi:hypothetical protein